LDVQLKKQTEREKEIKNMNDE